MTIKEAYEQYKHLDELLTDPTILPDGLPGQILYFLWQAIKEEIKSREDDLHLRLY